MHPLLSEQVLMDSMPPLSGDRYLVVSPGRAQSAWRLVEQNPHASVQAWYLDLHNFRQAKLIGSEQAAGGKVDYCCSSDLPEAEYDAVLMPVLKRGEAELTRELMQQAHQRLKIGGYLIVAVDNPKDTWLHEQMQAIFSKVTCQPHREGRAYWARKHEPLKRLRNFHAQFQFRDERRTLTAFTRPGVFSHRSLDTGARQLINSVEIEPQDHVLDFGCGAGVVALACAARTAGKVLGVDANARAMDCLRQAAAHNGLNNIEAIWNADGHFELPVAIDVALANPPYFGDQVIWQHFVDHCYRCLRPGGALLVVTKQPSWYMEYLDRRFENLSFAPAGHYFIVHGWALK